MLVKRKVYENGIIFRRVIKGQVVTYKCDEISCKFSNSKAKDEILMRVPSYNSLICSICIAVDFTLCKYRYVPEC